MFGLVVSIYGGGTSAWRGAIRAMDLSMGALRRGFPWYAHVPAVCLPFWQVPTGESSMVVRRCKLETHVCGVLRWDYDLGSDRSVEVQIVL